MLFQCHYMHIKNVKNEFISEIKPIKKFWLGIYDNDFPKLNKIRDIYIECEKKFKNLDSDLKNTKKQLFELSNSLSENSALEKWHQKLDDIRLEIAYSTRKLINELKTVPQIDNEERLKQISDDGDSVLARELQNLESQFDYSPKMAIPKIHKN